MAPKQAVQEKKSIPDEINYMNNSPSKNMPTDADSHSQQEQHNGVETEELPSIKTEAILNRQVPVFEDVKVKSALDFKKEIKPVQPTPETNDKLVDLENSVGGQSKDGKLNDQAKMDDSQSDFDDLAFADVSSSED